jgi:TDG/mug DNA glycosylase family protein
LPASRPPTPDEVRAAYGRYLPELIAPGLDILFCGINPGLYSAAVGLHFARPGNRFYPALYQAGLTPRLLAPHEGDDLLRAGYGITSLVRRATARASELDPSELVAGRRRLARRVRTHRPRWVALLGVAAYRTAFGRPKAVIGPQDEVLAGAGLWLLPSPSGANGSYPLTALVRELRTFRDVIRESNHGRRR